jgi:hypothetical protein
MARENRFNPANPFVLAHCPVCNHDIATVSTPSANVLLARHKHRGAQCPGSFRVVTGRTFPRPKRKLPKKGAAPAES